MKPCSAAENGIGSNSSLRVFLQGSESQRLQNVEGLTTAVCEFWDGQWPSLSKDSADFNRKSPMMYQNLVQGCDSPLASDSSSPLSTRDSSNFSWSEGSYSATKHVLHSPELPSSRFLGFSLFNSGVNHLDSVCTESYITKKSASKVKEQDGYTLHQAQMLERLAEPDKGSCGGSSGNLWPPDFECGTDHFIEGSESNVVEGLLDGDCVSDSSDLGVSAMPLFQELQRSCLSSGAGGMQCTKSRREWQCPVYARSYHHVNKSLVQADAACLDQAQCFDSSIELPEKDSGTNKIHNTAKVCSVVPCTQSYFKTTYRAEGALCESCLFKNKDGYGACSAKDHTQCSFMDPKILCAAPYKDSISRLVPHEENAGYTKGLADLVSADSIETLSQVLYKPLRPNVYPDSAHLEDARESFSRKKACYSAAVKERFASSTLHGYLRCAEQGDSPCYSFSLDDSDEVLFARASRQERKSNKENCDWTYSFHSKKDIVKAKGAWKGCPKKENLASDVVANMRVSSGVAHRKANSNQDGRIKEACFVLYDSRGQQQVGSRGAGSSSKMRGQPLKPVFDNTSTLQSGQFKEATEPNVLNPDAKGGAVKRTVCQHISAITRSSHFEAAKKELGTRVSSGGKPPRPNHLQQAELAAIIITTSAKEKKIKKKKESPASVKAAAGWGMKFLDKGTECGWGMNFLETSSGIPRGLEEVASCKSYGMCDLPDCHTGDLSRTVSKSHSIRPYNDQGDILGNGPDLAQNLEKKMKVRKNRLKVDVTVILPAGDHGLPDEDDDSGDGVPGSHGPTPLLERWMSGGDCECGGWDMGCGLSVFKAETLTLCRRTANIALTRNDRMNWISTGSPFKLSTQGYKQKKVLVLDVIEAGLFSMSFQARFSPLQAFAIAVALCHLQMTQK